MKRLINLFQNFLSLLIFIEKILKKNKSIFIGIFAFALILLLPTPEGLSSKGHKTIAIFVLATIFWISEAIPLGATTLLIFALLPLLGIVEPKNAFVGFGHHAIFFLIGAFLLTSALQKHNLHKRIALKFLVHFGKNPNTLLLGVVLMGSFMSMLMPAHAVAALLLPILMGIFDAFEDDLSDTNFSKSIMLAFSYGTSAGSMGTYLGGARNMLAAGLYQKLTGEEIGFFSWIVVAFPLVVLMTAASYFVLKIVFPPENFDMKEARTYMKKEVERMGSLSKNEKKTLIIFALTFFSWVFFGIKWGLATIAVLAGVILFLTKTLEWKDVEIYMPWGIIFLYGGAITLGKTLVDTEAAIFIATKIIDFVGQNPYILLLTFAVFTILVTEFMSDSAAAAVVLPIALAVMISINFSPVVAMYTVALCSGMAFMLIIATPSAAIAYSSGYLRQKDFLKAGFWVNSLGILSFMVVALTWWKFLGML